MATLNKRGNSWELDWYDHSGKRRRKSLGKISKQEANIARIAKELELTTGESPLPTKRIFDVFVDEYSNWFNIMHPSSSDRDESMIRLHLSPYFGSMSLNQISIRHGEQYIVKRMNEGAKSGTIIKEIRKLKAILNKAVEYEYIDKNRLKGLKEPADLDSKPPRYYTTEEMNEIIRVSPNHSHWWKLVANTGLRRKELYQLKWEHIDTSSVKILSTTEARTKSGKWRDVPLNQAAIDAIKSFSNETEYLLPRINPRSISRAFENDLKRANIDGSLHCLRHTFCSHLVMNGTPLRTVQVLAGHASYTTTEKYAHLAPEHMKEATDALNLF